MDLVASTWYDDDDARFPEEHPLRWTRIDSSSSRVEVVDAQDDHRVLTWKNAFYIDGVTLVVRPRVPTW